MRDGEIMAIFSRAGVTGDIEEALRGLSWDGRTVHCITGDHLTFSDLRYMTKKLVKAGMVWSMKVFCINENVDCQIPKVLNKGRFIAPEQSELPVTYFCLSANLTVFFVT